MIVELTTRRNDEDLRRDIQRQVEAALFTEPGGLTIRVNGGVATVIGQLEHADQVPVLLDLLRGTAGVVAVDPHLSYPKKRSSQRPGRRNREVQL